MEQWQKDFFEVIQTVTDEVERFFQGVTEVVDEFFEFSEEFTEQLQDIIATEIDQYLNDLAEPLLDVYWELEEGMSDIEYFPTVEPSPEEHPACMGCRHYHGQVYGGNLLVCGMHPYGWDGETCPDWEQCQ